MVEVNVSVSAVLRLGVQALHEKACGKQPALRAFAKHVGRYDTGQADGSVRSKAIVTEALDRRHPRTALTPDCVSN
jgi:hypothetical protein